MVLMVEQNHGEHLIRRFATSNEPDPRDVKITSLKQRIQELEFPQLQQDSPAEEAETGKKDLVRKGRIWWREDNIEDVVVVANDLCSSMIQTILSVDFEEDINTKSHELMSFEKSIIIKVQRKKGKHRNSRIGLHLVVDSSGNPSRRCTLFWNNKLNRGESSELGLELENHIRIIIHGATSYQTFFVGGIYGVEEGMFCTSPELIIPGVISLGPGLEVNSLEYHY
ncbi:hypothetical protein Tco_0020087 [Tanacetum coccineum]